MLKPSSSIPLPVARALLKLGSDLSLARRRRHISQASLAERMGASLSTVRRMEKGDARVPIHFFARALHVFGELQALEHLLDTPKDEIGLALMDEHLPKRVRGKSSTPSGAL
ncbi:MAG: helix-turn-helix transcriptional regulator [Proteobacteria bacterium]|nr:helix-turn-helix transcriptional regulator [Pseudomonadota bacterium]